jgi:hypothetical protein
MTVTPAVLYALSVFALVGGRVFGGIQWHHWNRQQRLHGKGNAPALRSVDQS